VLRATGRSPVVAGRGASGALAAGSPDREYLRFLSNCGLVEVDWGMRAERDNRTAQTVAWRRHREITAFVGGRCRQCGTVQFPLARACVNPDCRAFDTQEPQPLAGLCGRVKTFTEDWLAVTRSPPHVYGNVALDGGGNVFIEFADTPAGALAVGAQVRFVFRIKDVDAVRGFHRYFWKATPAGH
jgi:hydroxymethylglutaryl-CoA synthase